MSEANETHSAPETEQLQPVLARILNLSIFFVGIGVYSLTGFGLQQTALFTPYRLTYFTVGVVVGAVGLLLWLVTR